MNRPWLAVVAVALLTPSWAQDPHLETGQAGPRGGPVEVIHALFVQAQMLEDGQAMFCFPRREQVPSLIAKVDGKEVRALGADLRPLRVAELEERLPGWTGVVVVQG